MHVPRYSVELVRFRARPIASLRWFGFSGLAEQERNLKAAVARIDAAEIALKKVPISLSPHHTARARAHTHTHTHTHTCTHTHTHTHRPCLTVRASCAAAARSTLVDLAAIERYCAVPRLPYGLAQLPARGHDPGDMRQTTTASTQQKIQNQLARTGARGYDPGDSRP